METLIPTSAPSTVDTRPAKLWLPRRVVFTPDALKEPFGQQIYRRVSALGLPIEEARSNRITGLKGEDERETYRNAKNTLAVVTAPPGAFRLQPIPPSADWQFHLAEGCPAHCQYCYLAGSLSGPPVIRTFANLPAILANTARYEGPGGLTTFEASCYTDPLGIEHLTGSLSECIRYFGTRPGTQLRWVTKFDKVDELLDLPHYGRTRCRLSLNAEPVARRLEGGTASVTARLQALRKLALPKAAGGGGYPVGVVLAPKGDGHPEKAHDQTEPTYGVLGTSGGDQASDDREGQEGYEHHQSSKGSATRRGLLRGASEGEQRNARQEHGHRERGERPSEPGGGARAHPDDSPPRPASVGDRNQSRT